VRKQAGHRDLEIATDYYDIEGGPDIADRFLDAVQETHDRISRHPRAGSLRYGRDIGIAGLRSRPAPRFPYLIFYIETRNHIEVSRVLHSHSDIPARLREGKTGHEPEPQ
jgi:toxin ParE1/3/4